MKLILTLVTIAVVFDILKTTATELTEEDKERSLTDVYQPKCKIHEDKNGVTCSIQFKWLTVYKTVSVMFTIDKNQAGNIYVTLLFDGTEIIEQELNDFDVCSPLPGKLRPINMCAKMFRTKVGISPPPVSFNTCFIIVIADSFYLKMGCVSLDKDRVMKHHWDYQPEYEGVMMLTLDEGNLKFKLNNPIEKSVMDQIVSEWQRDQ